MGRSNCSGSGIALENQKAGKVFPGQNVFLSRFLFFLLAAKGSCESGEAGSEEQQGRWLRRTNWSRIQTYTDAINWDRRVNNLISITIHREIERAREWRVAGEELEFHSQEVILLFA